MKNNYHVLIPCAGSGSRFGSSMPKQYYPLLDKTVLDWTLLAFLELLSTHIQSITVIYSAENLLIDEYIQRYPQVSFIACGGNSRAQTVINGLASLNKHHTEQDWVMVHDAARCLINGSDIISLIEHVEQNGIGCILASKATDTIKQVISGCNINKTLDRQTIYLAQTPQLFQSHELFNALKNSDLNIITDESSAIELHGGISEVVISKYPNFKITYFQDIQFAEVVLQNHHHKE